MESEGKFKALAMAAIRFFQSDGIYLFKMLISRAAIASADRITVKGNRFVPLTYPDLYRLTESSCGHR